MTPAPEPLPVELRQDRVLAILRATSSRSFSAVATALVAEGLRCIEVTLTTPDALEALAQLRAELGTAACLGAGTVLTAADADAAVDAGAGFLVSPTVADDVVRVGRQRHVPTVIGAWTPTEVVHAWTFGASAVKIFPAAVGGPAYLRHLRGPLLGVPLLPTGGVAIDQVCDYLDAGAIAVGLGTPLVGRGELEPTEIRARARALLAGTRTAIVP